MPPCNGITLEEATVDQLQEYHIGGKIDECANSDVLHAEGIPEQGVYQVGLGLVHRRNNS